MNYPFMARLVRRTTRFWLRRAGSFTRRGMQVCRCGADRKNDLGSLNRHEKCVMIDGSPGDAPSQAEQTDWVGVRNQRDIGRSPRKSLSAGPKASHAGKPAWRLFRCRVSRQHLLTAQRLMCCDSLATAHPTDPLLTSHMRWIVCAPR
jgi:hypothetical protein